jgi:hypothetical protein
MIPKFNLLCFSCKKEYKASEIPNPQSGVGHKCECGGYVVSPSGKVQLKKVE